MRLRRIGPVGIVVLGLRGSGNRRLQKVNTRGKKRTVFLIATLLAVFISGSVAAQDSRFRGSWRSDLIAQTLNQRSTRWVCSPSELYVYAPDGCKRSPGLGSVHLDFANKTYARCDSKGCDTHAMTFSAGGIYTTGNFAERPDLCLESSSPAHAHISR